VAQLTGYISEHSGYHHGEDSLNKAIVGMAQNFVGTNNINLLYPSGQFGSRIKGGQDASSPRYIFTRLERITRCIFPEQDDRILNYLDDDGTSVEPQFYVPIIPMVLINGSKGIGTGFSTEIMCYNPIDIIAYLKNKLSGLSEVKDKIEFIPYYNGFTGITEKVGDKKFVFKGRYEKIDMDKIRVTELPVGYWTENFKELLCELQNDKDAEGKKIIPVVKDVFENYTDTTIEFVITFGKGKVEELEAIACDYGCNGLEKALKLYSTNTTTNMNLFDENDKLVKYDTVEEIIDAYYEIRIDHYADRKEYIIDALEVEIMILSNKAKYIMEVLEGTIDLRKKKKQEIIDMLIEHDYDTIDEDNEFRYLVRMPMDSVSEENVEKLVEEHERKVAELERVKTTTIEQMWLSELELLEIEYRAYQQERDQSQIGEVKKTKTKGVTKVAGGSTKMVKKSVAGQKTLALAGGGPVTKLAEIV
jgi:DNA topoisomerase-2